MTAMTDAAETCAHCAHTRDVPRPSVWRGNAAWPLLAVVLAGGLAIWVFPQLVAESPETALTTLALIGLAIGGLGALLRAIAHQRAQLMWLDHTGKLLNVSAIAFAFWAAAGRSPHLQPLWSMIIYWSIVTVAALALLWSTLVFIQWGRASRSR